MKVLGEHMKSLATSLLTPGAPVVDVWAPWRRVWAQKRLATLLEAPVPASLVLLGLPVIRGTKRLELGRDLYLYRDLYFETQGAGSISLGAGVVLARGVQIIAYAPVTIGAGVMIGEHTRIRAALDTPPRGGPVRLTAQIAAPITIEHEVWIGRGVTILPGVSIGARAVIGDHVVVAQDVPAGAVLAGRTAPPLLVQQAA
jgi:acetyltransferase-like isoleucine patch superfamily enzyme